MIDPKVSVWDVIMFVSIGKKGWNYNSWKKIKYFSLRQYHLPVLSCQINCIKNAHTSQSIFSRNSQKVCEFFKSAARPETLSMTITLSNIIFSPK